MTNLDDAGVYKLTDDLAIIQTVDFFTPVVDEPYAFGQIAVTNAGAEAGDRLVLTKLLGTGIINTAMKARMVDKKLVGKVTTSMATLNNKASELMQEMGVHACTDVTGYGLLGHASQLVEHSQAGIELHMASIPYFPEVVEFSQQGLLPAGLYRNRDYYSRRVKFASEIPEYMKDILFDAQTSGGLLICVSPDKSERMLNRLRQSGVGDAALIGEVVSEPKGMITLR